MSNLNLTKETIELAMSHANEMVEADEIIRKVQFGRDGGCFWLSNDASCLIEPVRIPDFDKNFYIAIFPA